MTLTPREFLMIPGPTPVPDRVLEAIARHPIGHRTPEFSQMLKDATLALQEIGETKNDLYLLTASGTAAMEAAICNTVNRGDRVLSLVCGVFSERWAKIAEAYGAHVERLRVEPGQAIDIEALQETLQKSQSKPFKAVTITHNETSTGVINDLPRILEVVQSHGALSIVDAVTSFGAVHIPIDTWQIDVLVTGSQKALMLPPGLAFIFFGKKAWQAFDTCHSPRFYLDLGKARKSLAEDTTPFTPNVSFIAGLKVSLEMLMNEGMPNVYARHERLQSRLRTGLKSLGLQLLVADACASPTITAILPPAAKSEQKVVSIADIRKGLKQDFRILVADGQESLKGKIFRIGHMGYVFDRDILMTLAALDTTLQSLGFASSN